MTATAVTDGNGAYSFATDSNNNVLLPGTYQLVETLPSGYLADVANVGTVNNASDGSVVSPTAIGSIVMGAGQNGASYDFGNVKPVMISGLVYMDTNNVGAYQTGDAGVPGVTMTLTGTNNLGQSVSVTTTTASDGTYSFSKDSSGNPLPPGTYVITETVPNGYVPGAATVGTVKGTSDGKAVSGTQINSIAMPEGQAGINYLFGLVPAQPVAISGYVYVDVNHDTNKDPGDPADGNADEIMLTGTNILGQSVTAYTTTDPNTGAYSFTVDNNGNKLLPGTYTITFLNTSYPYLFEYANVGTVNGAFIGANAGSNVISQIVLTSGQAGVNYDFAEIVAGS